MSTVEITVEQIGKIKKIKITLSSNKPKVEFDAYTSGVFPLSMYLYFCGVWQNKIRSHTVLEHAFFPPTTL